MLETLSREIRSRCSELIYADDLTLVSETLERLKGRLEACEGALGSKGLRIYVKNTKMMICGENTGKVTIENKFPCTLCRKGVGNNSILC